MKHTHYIRQSYLFCLYRNYVYDFKKYLTGRNVLEVGPNKGALFEKYYPLTKKYTLLEPNRHFERAYVKLQRKHPNLSYEFNTFEAFGASETFDTIVMMAVIAHMKKSAPQEIYSKIDSLLNKGGFLIVETNNTKRNLATLTLCDRNYEKLEVKTSYGGIMRWLRIDYRDVLVYRKP